MAIADSVNFVPLRRIKVSTFMTEKYHDGDPMSDVISDDYRMLQILSRFGITLGFGDKSVSDTCKAAGVDVSTFLTVVNYVKDPSRAHINDMVEQVDLPALIRYLKNSHSFFVDFRLPNIRRRLIEALDCSASNQIAFLILKFYDEYAAEVAHHMEYENTHVHPFVESLLRGELPSETFAAVTDQHNNNHLSIEKSISELKSIIIKYFPGDSLRNNQLSATLYDIYNNEEWLALHAEVEDKIFIPAIKYLEDKSRQSDVSAKISSMIGKNQEGADALGEREKDVIVALVQGMSNKEIAEHLCISVNTVITHRRNIARKLQIHSPAGLTIYAIVNNLIDISAVKL